MSTEVKLRRGTTTQHSSFTGVQAEITVDTTKKTVVVHDGSTAGGHPLLKESAIGNTVQAYDDNLTDFLGVFTLPDTDGSANQVLKTDGAGNLSFAAAGSGSGTVTSVDITLPTGLVVTGNPITTSGTFAVVFQTGYSIPTNTKQGQWDTAYGWGNHASAGYLTSYTETDPIYTASSWYTTTNNSSNWNTAYGWGNHASAGYLTSSAIGSSVLAYDSNLQSFVTTFTLPTTDGTNGYVLTTNGSGTLSWQAASGGSMTYPGAGIAVSTGSAWGTSLTAPTGTIVGTSDSQTLTNKTISVDDNTVSGIAASSFVVSNSSGNIDGSAAQKAIPTGVVVGTTDSQTLTNKTLTDPIITGTITEDVFTITDTAGFAIDPTNGSIQLVTLGASRTPTQANWAAGESVTLMVNDGTAYTITWSTIGVVWVGSSAPTLATTGYSVIQLWKVGTTVYGAYVGAVA